jgi:hypothetical protein
MGTPAAKCAHSDCLFQGCSPFCTKVVVSLVAPHRCAGQGLTMRVRWVELVSDPDMPVTVMM